jgi:protein-S-isoprenylcysteine O-methyltransferase Ste14
MGPGAKLIPKLLFQNAMLLVVDGVLLFGGAGTLDWPSAWVFLAVFGAASLAVSLWLAWADPGLLAERMKPPIQAAQKTWDKVFLLAGGLLFLSWTAFLGIDARRFAWSYAPVWAQVLGAACIVFSFAGIAWVYRTNSFAAPVIKMQADGEQTVISTGPYAFVRHPMYGFGFFTFIGLPLMTGSLWGLAALPLIAVPLHLRTLGEERMLKTELDGYEAYARRVRFRYAPGIW